MSSSLKNRKILFLLVNDITHDQRIQRMAQTLQKAGSKVCIFGRKHSWSEEVNWGDIQLRRFSIHPDRGPLMYFNMNRIFAREGRLEPWDIVVSNDFDTLWAGKRIAAKWNSKWVFDAHEYFTEVPELEGRHLKKSIWNQLGKWCIPKTDLALTVSESMAEELSVTYKRDFQSIPNVPYRRIKSKSSEQENIILYQGALNKGRGLEVAIKAMHQLEDLKLVLAGEGDLSKTLRQLVQEERLDDKVRFLGRVEPDELKKITDTAWVGLNLLSGSSLNYYYSLANKFFDYAQAGIPSINMDFPEYRRFIDQFHCGTLLSSLDVNEYVDCIQSLKKDSERYQDLCKGASSLAEDYYWEAFAPKLIRLYESLFD